MSSFPEDHRVSSNLWLVCHWSIGTSAIGKLVHRVGFFCMHMRDWGMQNRVTVFLSKMFVCFGLVMMHVAYVFFLITLHPVGEFFKFKEFSLPVLCKPYFALDLSVTQTGPGGGGQCVCSTKFGLVLVWRWEQHLGTKAKGSSSSPGAFPILYWPMITPHVFDRYDGWSGPTSYGSSWASVWLSFPPSDHDVPQSPRGGGGTAPEFSCRSNKPHSLPETISKVPSPTSFFSLYCSFGTWQIKYKSDLADPGLSGIPAWRGLSHRFHPLHPRPLWLAMRRISIDHNNYLILGVFFFVKRSNHAQG